MNNTLKELTRKLSLVVVGVGAIAFVIYWYGLLDPIETFFIAFGYTGILVLQEGGEVGLALYLFFIQACCWGAFYFFIKVTVIDTLFPVIRIVTPEKDAFKVCRRVKMYEPPQPDKHFVYMRVKFHKWPVLRWHILKVPKPMVTGSFSKKVVENGVKGVLWRRMPATLDILTNTIDVGWNGEMYEIGFRHDATRDDPAEPYDRIAFESIQKTGESIIESCKGDFGLIKDQFHMGIVVREKETLKPKIDEEDTVVRRDVIRRLKNRE